MQATVLVLIIAGVVSSGMISPEFFFREVERRNFSLVVHPPEGCRCVRDPVVPDEISCACRGLSVRDVPDNLTKGLTRLSLESVSITVLKAGSLQVYKDSLRDLVLDRVKELTEIKDGAFNELRYLRTISIKQALKLKSISDGVFNCHLPNLKIVRIIQSGLEMVPNLQFLDTRSVIYMVDLDSNKIRHLPRGAVKMKTEMLNLDFNLITKIESKAFFGSEIAKLSLKGNTHLQFIEEGAFLGLKNIRTLDLSEASISTLPTKGLEELEVLRLSEVYPLKVFPSVYHFKYIKAAFLTYPYHCCAFRFPAAHDPEEFSKFVAFRENVQRLYCSNPTTTPSSPGEFQNSQEGGFRKKEFQYQSSTQPPEGVTEGDFGKKKEFQYSGWDVPHPTRPPDGMMDGEFQNLGWGAPYATPLPDGEFHEDGFLDFGLGVKRPIQPLDETAEGGLREKEFQNSGSGVPFGTPGHEPDGKFRIKTQKEFQNPGWGVLPRQTPTPEVESRKQMQDSGMGRPPIPTEGNSVWQRVHHRKRHLNSHHGVFQNNDDKQRDFIITRRLQEWGGIPKNTVYQDFWSNNGTEDDFFGNRVLQQLKRRRPPGLENPFEGVFHGTTVAVISEVELEAFCGQLAKNYRDVECSPSPDAFNPCEDVMGNRLLRVAVWAVALTALAGNAAVMAVLLGTGAASTVSKFLMCNLAFADFCMGLYLLMIAAMDLHSIGEYFNYAIDWQHGPGCQVAGFLTVFATELSIYTLTVISVERWYAITCAINLDRRLKLRRAAHVMCCGWGFALAMAALPLAGLNGFSRTSICLPMRNQAAGDVAYLAVLLAANSAAFGFIFFCYGHMYATAIRRPTRPTRATPNDMAVAKRMALLVVTDFLCWSPVAFFAATAVAGYPLIDVTRSKILLVFFYPLNSCANPFLYAIFTTQYRRDFLGLLARCEGGCRRRKDRRNDCNVPPLQFTQRRRYNAADSCSSQVSTDNSMRVLRPSDLSSGWDEQEVGLWYREPSSSEDSGQCCRSSSSNTPRKGSPHPVKHRFVHLDIPTVLSPDNPLVRTTVM